MAGCEKGFVKCFLIIPFACLVSIAAVQPNYLWNSQETFYNTFFTTCRPRVYVFTMNTLPLHIHRTHSCGCTTQRRGTTGSEAPPSFSESLPSVSSLSGLPSCARYCSEIVLITPPCTSRHRGRGRVHATCLYIG